LYNIIKSAENININNHGGVYMSKSKSNNSRKGKKKQDKKTKPTGLTNSVTESPGVDSKYYPKANPEIVL